MRIIMARSLLRVGAQWAQGAVADPPHTPPLFITVWAVAASVWLGQSMWFWDRHVSSTRCGSDGQVAIVFPSLGCGWVSWYLELASIPPSSSKPCKEDA